MSVEPLRGSLRVTVSVSGALVNNFMFGVCVRVSGLRCVSAEWDRAENLWCVVSVTVSPGKAYTLQ